MKTNPNDRQVLNSDKLSPVFHVKMAVQMVGIAEEDKANTETTARSRSSNNRRCINNSRSWARRRPENIVR